MRSCFVGCVLCAALLAAVPCSSQARWLRGDPTVQSIVVNGVTRTFVMHKPAGLKPGPVPLVVALHGGGTNGKSMQRFSGLDEAADRYGFIVVYPDGTGPTGRFRTWNSGACDVYARKQNVDDVTFLAALIDHLVQTQAVDPQRVYVTGISNGGMMSYRLAAEIPDRVAAIAAVAGTLDVPAASIRQPVPILHFHGTADEYVLYEGGHGPKTFSDNDHTSVADTMAAWVKVNGANPSPKEELLPDTSDDGMRVRRYTYATKTDPQNIVLYKIEGGGHTWPGRPAKIERMLGPATTDISANDILWLFFQTHPKPSAGSITK